MADLFWYELSLSDPDLYMEAQTQYLKALADFLSPDLPQKDAKDVRASPFSDQTLKMYSPDLSDRGKFTARSHLDEVPVQGMVGSFDAAVERTVHSSRRTPDRAGNNTQRRGKGHTKGAFSVALTEKPKTQAKQQPEKPKNIVKDGRKKLGSGKKTSERRSNSMFVGLHPKPEFRKLINDGSKPPGDLESVVSSVGDLEISELITTDRGQLLAGLSFAQLCSKYLRKCPFCGILEDIETDPLPPLQGPKNRLTLKNGGWKDFFPDGSVIAKLPNGDYKHTFPRGQIVYLFAVEKVVQVIYPLKHTISLFPSGQLEVVCPEGRKFVCFPDKTAAMVHPNGTLEDIEPFLC